LNQNFSILAFQTQRHKDSKKFRVLAGLIFKDTRDFIPSVSEVLEKGKGEIICFI